MLSTTDKSVLVVGRKSENQHIDKKFLLTLVALITVVEQN